MYVWQMLILPSHWQAGLIVDMSIVILCSVEWLLLIGLLITLIYGMPLLKITYIIEADRMNPDVLDLIVHTCNHAVSGKAI